ncbi:hypothetical protein RHS01_10409 [Rhizoctonia solani]|uniref:Uncharacterized protein n=1 Tax=Rhizoctonia solani TaxID=456999 RepID=A0A8H7I552_9AGAM|nr:hypothetical protein RHS01_10409 [Rhizoctonia solani]
MLRNLTLDDYSPFIQYDSSWVDANITTDDRMNYQNSTFRHTNIYDAKATITFRGSGLYIYGAKRTDHGLYQIAVNNEPPMAGNGYSSGSNIYQTLLFGRSNLRNQPNTVALQNIPDSGRSWLDIDYVVITYETDTDTSEFVDIDSGKFTYSSEWDTEIMSGYRTSVPHVTRTAGATATLDFQGSEITLYGRTGPNFGMFRVQVDNQEALTLNATRENSYPPTVLYTTNGLSAGKHTITLTNLEANKALAVDYATCIPHAGCLAYLYWDGTYVAGVSIATKVYRPCQGRKMYQSTTNGTITTRTYRSAAIKFSLLLDSPSPADAFHKRAQELCFRETWYWRGTAPATSKYSVGV